MNENPRKIMEQYLADIVIPVLRNKGFKGSFPHFRRLKKDRINLITFQFAMRGGSFVLEIANYNLTDFETSWGKKIPLNKLTAHDLSVRKRIQSNMETNNSSTSDWFQFEKKSFFSFGDIYRKTCSDVLAKLPIAEEYWENGPLSEH